MVTAFWPFWIRRITTALMLATVTACQESAGPVEPIEKLPPLLPIVMTVGPDGREISLLDSLQLGASTNGPGVPNWTWQAHDTSLATVNSTGLVHPRRAGTVAVRACFVLGTESGCGAVTVHIRAATVAELAGTYTFTHFALTPSLSLTPLPAFYGRGRFLDGTLVLRADGVAIRRTHGEFTILGQTTDWVGTDTTIWAIRNDGTVILRSAAADTLALAQPAGAHLDLHVPRWDSTASISRYQRTP